MFSGDPNEKYTLTFLRQHEQMVDVIPITVEISPGGAKDFLIGILGKSPGSMELTAEISPKKDLR